MESLSKLATNIPGSQPIVTCESNAELVSADMRKSPDRIVVGEIRGGEEILQAMTTGHHGSYTTIHADCNSLEKLQEALKLYSNKKDEPDYLPMKEIFQKVLRARPNAITLGTERVDCKKEQKRKSMRRGRR